MNDEQKEKTDLFDDPDPREVFSKVVRAGKRTYFFDVKATRRNDYFLSITESKKRFHKDGRFYFEKHKIFLYKEDIGKFLDGFDEVLDYMRELLSDRSKGIGYGKTEEYRHDLGSSFAEVEFDDLESVELEEKQIKG